MITFNIITIFPGLFDFFKKESLIARAEKKGLIKIKVHNLRKWTKDRHKTVYDRPYGGGLGMVLKPEPVWRAISQLKKAAKKKGEKTRVILFTPRGKIFNQKMVYQFSRLDNLIFICGRYEGVDERIAKYLADIELSIGEYDLMGGELPAMVVIEAVSRLIPGVLGKPQLLKERITKEKGFIEYPQYTRPEVIDPKNFLKDLNLLPSRARRVKKWRVPKVLLSGNHKEIKEWRKKHRKIIEK
ncbi:MAG TPA: tRNA (guanosine(37)-N1)-methyltransferase TrmD [Candidatus Parcubacteria bacterium]|nr:tRNA (guanosine(37)-N1)-methyltransferase TrmD [Candidatus Parcubacteria bacterium]